MITKNFRLNVLANQYAAALHEYIAATSGGEHFVIDAGDKAMQVNIRGGVKGLRDLIDGYVLEALKEAYPQWESVGIALLEKCVNSGGLTEHGHEIWQSMVNDMGATVAENGGRFDA